MDPDIYFVVGLVISIFSIPPILGAFNEGRAPRAAAITILIGGGLVVLAANQKPSGYAIEDIPDVFVRVVGMLVG